MASSTSFFITKDEFKAFHKIDRAVFSRLVLTLRRDINQSYQIMSFFLFLEKSGIVSNLIANLVSSPDFFLNGVADEVLVCLTCMSYDAFPTFVASLGQNTNSSNLTLIMRLTKEFLTLAVVHQYRETILLEMKKHLFDVCYPAFDDIRVAAEKMYAEERDKAIMEMNQLGSSSKAGPSSQFSNKVQQSDSVVVAALSEDQQARMADERTVFLTFSRGYPISQEEVHAFFTRRFGEIIEAIHMPEVEGEQALYARMVLHSAAMIPEIVTGAVSRTKFTINGKHVWARKYIPKTSGNLPASSGVSV